MKLNEEKLEKVSDEFKQLTTRYIAKHGPLVRTFLNNIELCRATRQNYFNTFTGNSLRRLLTNIETLSKDLPNEVPELNERFQVLRLLSKIQDYGKPQFLTSEEIKELKTLINELEQKMKSELMRNSAATPKWHMLLKRIPLLLDKYNSYAYFTEQAVEAVHQRIKELRKKICVNDEKIIHERLLKDYWVDNVLNDLTDGNEDYTKFENDESIEEIIVDEPTTSKQPMSTASNF